MIILPSAADALLKSGRKIAIAESCTGGLLGAEITSLSGSSSFFLGGVIAYSNGVKENILKVSGRTLADHGAVSEETAREMARGVRELLGSDVAVSITGIAGPTGGTEMKPVGLVYIGVASGNSVSVKRYMFGGERDDIRRSAVLAAIGDLVKALS